MRTRNLLGSLSLIGVLVLSTTGCRILGTGVRTVEETPAPGIVLAQTPSRLKGLKIADVCAFKTVEPPQEAFPLQSDTLRKLVEKVKPAVLNIYVKTAYPVGVYLLGVRIPGTRVNIPGESLGSGFICSPDGYVLSNAHVVNRAAELSAKTHDGKEYPLEIIAIDAQADIALLRLVQNEPMPYLPMVASRSLEVGDWVIAIGNPLGFNHLVSHGIFSHRHVPETDDPDRSEFIFSDAPINPGNSGGPLIGLGGHAVGINTAVVRETQGISLTIPTEQVQAFLARAIEVASN